MPRTAQDLERFLLRLERPFEPAGEGTWLLSGGPDAPPVVVRVAPPVVLLRVELGPVPSGTAAEARVFRRLLELDASDLIHASYGVEGDRVTLSASLELDNLDLNELEAALADIDLALAGQVESIRGLY
jgi:hypothetical protein